MGRSCWKDVDHPDDKFAAMSSALAPNLFHSRQPPSRSYDCVQDEVSDLMYNWVAQRSDFKSALRVVKMVLNTQCYQYLWLTMWFHAKKLKETLKNSKSLILQCKFGSRAQKWPKIAQKTDHLIAIYSIFFIGMVYFGCLQVNPHIQAVQNMCSKGG